MVVLCQQHNGIHAVIGKLGCGYAQHTPCQNFLTVYSLCQLLNNQHIVVAVFLKNGFAFNLGNLEAMAVLVRSGAVHAGIHCVRHHPTAGEAVFDGSGIVSDSSGYDGMRQAVVRAE